MNIFVISCKKTPGNDAFRTRLLCLLNGIGHCVFSVLIFVIGKSIYYKISASGLKGPCDGIVMLSIFQQITPLSRSGIFSRTQPVAEAGVIILNGISKNVLKNSAKKLNKKTLLKTQF
jgi:hypothetical protein